MSYDENYFDFFGERINPTRYKAETDALEARIAETDAEVFSGNLTSLIDAMELHAVLHGVIRSLEYAEEEEEEDEEG